MEKVEILSMLNILKKAYPSYYKNFSKEEAKEVVDFYEEIFKEDDSKLVLLALKEIINTSEFPPTIATIKNKMFDITHKEQYSNDELWEALVKALSRSSYYADEEFEKLPELVKLYIRSPYQLQRLAEMESEKVHSVEKGIFMKQIEKIKQDYKNNIIAGRKDNLLMNKGIYQLEEVIEDEY